jgi:hypothetical protein
MEDKTLYIFDMDNTLIETPKFVDFVNVENGEIKTENENIKEYINKLKGIYSLLLFKEICFKRSGDFIVVVDCRNAKEFGKEQIEIINNLTLEQFQKVGFKNSAKKELQRAFEIKDGLLVLREFPGFYESENTVGDIVVKRILSIYSSVKNKMILTGRKEKLRGKIEERLKELNIEMPNFGLILFPSGSMSIPEYKIKAIENTILENGWKEIHFFEDRAEWLNKAAVEISKKFPEIKFHKHLITDINSKLTL